MHRVSMRISGSPRPSAAPGPWGWVEAAGRTGQGERCSSQ
ncbi:hypothetical protein [Azospirillum argentinense]